MMMPMDVQESKLAPDNRTEIDREKLRFAQEDFQVLAEQEQTHHVEIRCRQSHEGNAVVTTGDIPCRQNRVR